MATYDPEAARSRPAAPKDSPVDALLDGESKANNNTFDTAEELSEEIDENVDSAEEQEEEPSTNSGESRDNGESRDSGDFRPFEVPPVESVDESADRANRLGALIATLVLFCLAIFWKKRNKASP